MESAANIYERIKGLRTAFEVSAAEMAAVTGVTEAEYLDMEAGKTDLTFTFLYKFAARLGVDLSGLVSGDEPRLTSYTLSRQGEGMPIKRRSGFDYLHLAYLFKDRLAEPFLVTAKYAAGNETAVLPLSSHTGQEFNYILEGTLRVRFEDHEELLQPGDSTFYKGDQPHGMVAVGGCDCRFLSVVLKGDAAEPDSYRQPVAETAVQTHVADDDRIYHKYVDETVNKKGELTGLSFHVPDNFNFGYDVVDALAQKSPDKLAMLWVSGDGRDERRLRFSDMAEQSSRAANFFRSVGIKKGDRVMLVLRRHYDFWFAILGLHKLGAVALPATDQLVEKDFVYRYDAAGVSAIVCTGHGDTAAYAESAAGKAKEPVTLIMSNGSRPGWLSFAEGLAAASPVFERVETSLSEPMLMYFTSGTTGYPKIAAHGFGYPIGHIVTGRWWHNVKSDGLHFTVADTGWGKAVWGKLYGQWFCEAAVFTYDFDRFDPVDLLPMFAKYQITTFCAPPTIFRFFIKEDISRYDLSSLTYATIAGEALNPEVYQQFYAATGIKLMEGFGQTETTLTVANLYGMEPKPGSMGKPTPGFPVRLLNSEGDEVKSGEVGEICISTKDGTPFGMYLGYFRNPEKTAEAWHDGFYHTGDMAWRDEDGYLWYVGRTDDLIKSSGYRIGPFEIESVLMELPYVLECAVTGVPHPIRGQIVKATIVLKAGTVGDDALKKEIQTYVKTHTAPYKYPREIEFVTDLPKTISGKIRRVDIRKNDEK